MVEILKCFRALLEYGEYLVEGDMGGNPIWIAMEANNVEGVLREIENDVGGENLVD